MFTLLASLQRAFIKEAHVKWAISPHLAARTLTKALEGGTVTQERAKRYLNRMGTWNNAIRSRELDRVLKNTTSPMPSHLYSAQPEMGGVGHYLHPAAVRSLYKAMPSDQPVPLFVRRSSPETSGAFITGPAQLDLLKQQLPALQAESHPLTQVFAGIAGHPAAAAGLQSAPRGRSLVGIQAAPSGFITAHELGHAAAATPTQNVMTAMATRGVLPFPVGRSARVNEWLANRKVLQNYPKLRDRFARLGVNMPASIRPSVRLQQSAGYARPELTLAANDAFNMMAHGRKVAPSLFDPNAFIHYRKPYARMLQAIAKHF